MNQFNVEKGSCIYSRGWWHVVVNTVIHPKTKKVSFLAICDNANNQYDIDPESVDYVLSPHDAFKHAGWGYTGNDDLQEILENRALPLDVIGEVITGSHDHRFEHYFKKDEQ